MLRLTDVNFRYESRRAENLKNIHLAVAPGEFVLVCGASGSGKSSLLRTVNKLIPDCFPGRFSGLVEINRQDIGALSMYELSRIVGSVFQNPKTQFFNVDTDSEIVFGLENRGVKQSLLQESLDRTVRDLGLTDLLGKSLLKLSGGQKQRIAFASVYAMDPEIFVLDEPSSNLDLPSIEALKELLALLKARGKTILISEHRIYYVLPLADKIVYMKDGAVAAVYSAAEFAALPDETVRAMGLRSRVPVAFAPARTAASGYPLSTASPASPASPHSTASPELELRNFALYRKDRCLLKNLSFSARLGDIIAVTGANGSGKSSFLRALAGLHKECRGEILWHSAKAGTRQRIKQSYMVMQDVNYQLFAESVMAECRLGLRRADDALIEAILEKFALLPYKDCHPNTLSGGQKQRLAIAAGLICNKTIFILDEPTSGLDYRSMIVTAELLQTFARDKILFIATHDPEFANLVCSRKLDLEEYAGR